MFDIPLLHNLFISFLKDLFFYFITYLFVNLFISLINV